MLEAGSPTSRTRATASAVLTAVVVALITMGFLSGGTSRLWLARNAAVRTTRPGQRQAREAGAHGPDQYGPAGGPAVPSVDPDEQRGHGAARAVPTPDAVAGAAVLPTLSVRELPVAVSAIIGTRAGATSRSGDRAPPLS